MLTNRNRRNVIFLIADDHRHDAFGARGNRQISTPNLDRLIQSGTSYTNAYISGSMLGAVCAPSRACLHTGLNPSQALVSSIPDDYPAGTYIREELPVLGETLQQHGYYTYATGKWHNGRASLQRSFAGGKHLFLGGMHNHDDIPLFPFDPTGQYSRDSCYTGDGYSTELFADAAVEFIEEYNREQPFFLYVAFTSPHDPRIAPEPFASFVDRSQIELPPNYMPEHPFDNGELRIRDELLAAFPRTEEEVRTHIGDYYAMIAHLDQQVGRILGALQQSGLSDNTVVVYTSDHGLAVGQHGLMGKQNLYEHSVKIPLIMAGPDIEAKSDDRFISQMDIYPLLCKQLDVNAPATLEGRLLHGRESVFAFYKDFQHMVRKGRYKLIRYGKYADSAEPSGRAQLFDVIADPWELHDLSADLRHTETLADLDELLLAWRQSIDAIRIQNEEEAR
ncbi:MAG: Choline-sulfatase [Paenibacillus sp.]|jgi:arylsulfatase A-like enzyme|nr:Choline-sulfatase [Paenibacillus sp.]